MRKKIREAHESEKAKAEEAFDMLKIKMPVGSVIQYLGKAAIVTDISEPFFVRSGKILDIYGSVVHVDYADKNGKMRKWHIKQAVAMNM